MLLVLAACGPITAQPSATRTQAAASSAGVSPSPGPSVLPLPSIAPPFEWRRVSFERSDPPVFLTGITSGGPGFVAVGGTTWRGGPVPPPGFESEAVVWTSLDGTTWRRVAAQQSLRCGCSMRAVTSGPAGLVAVGGTAAGSGRVWTSKDGLAWQLVATDAARQSWTLTAVAAGGPGLVAVGGHAVWTSVDGSRWDVRPTASFDAYALDRVASGGSAGLVALGGGLAWTSRDGVVWRPSAIPDRDAEALTAVGGVGDSLIAIGQRSVWRSRDGTKWDVISEDPNLDPIAITTEGWVAHGGWSQVRTTARGLVAVGASPVLEQNAATPILNTPTILFSKDGSSWIVQRLEAAIDAPLTGIATSGATIVVIGDVIGPDPQPAAWISKH